MSISDKDLFQLLHQRKSRRNYSKESIDLKELSYLLWCSTGIQRKEVGYEFRTAPSAGALYPIETYLVINNVEKLQSGIYHYNIKNHKLDELRLGNFSKQITRSALDQQMCKIASVVFIWTAIFDRSKFKYGQRAYRYIYLDAGHIAQNLALSATSVGLGHCHIGALYDDEVNSIIDVDGENESTIYMTAVGKN